jgi:hypothetical protein
MRPDTPQWPGPRPFVGREEVVRALRQELVQAMEDQGRAIILHGPPGSGRAALARLLLPPARDGGVRIAIGDAADPDEPAWSQIAHQLTARRRALRAVARTASGWIGLVPVIGPIAEAIVDTVHTLRKRRGRHEAEGPHGTGSTVDQVRLLLSEAPREPRLIILENLETGDPGELAGAFALVRRIRDTRTLFVGTSTSTGGTLPDEVSQLLEEIVRQGVGDALGIPPLTPDESVAAVREALGAHPPPEWHEWLLGHAPGTPERLWEVMGGLLERGALVPHPDTAGEAPTGWTWAREPSPADAWLVAIRDDEAEGLSDEDAQILATAARIGASFAVSDLARRLGVDELELQERLDSLTRRGRLAFEGTTEVEGELVDRYRFPDERIAARWKARTGIDPEY